MNSRRFRNSSYGVTYDSRMSEGLLINIVIPLALHAPRGTLPGSRPEHPARGTRHEARGTRHEAPSILGYLQHMPNATIAALLSLTSHELRQPTGMVRGYLRTLDQDPT